MCKWESQRHRLYKIVQVSVGKFWSLLAPTTPYTLSLSQFTCYSVLSCSTRWESEERILLRDEQSKDSFLNHQAQSQGLFLLMEFLAWVFGKSLIILILPKLPGILRTQKNIVSQRFLQQIKNHVDILVDSNYVWAFVSRDTSFTLSSENI